MRGVVLGAQRCFKREREGSKLPSKIALVSESLDLAAWRLVTKSLSTVRCAGRVGKTRERALSGGRY